MDCLVILQAIAVFTGRQEVPFGVRPASADGFRVVYGEVTKLGRFVPTIPAPTFAFANGSPPLGLFRRARHLGRLIFETEAFAYRRVFEVFTVFETHSFAEHGVILTNLGWLSFLPLLSNLFLRRFLRY